MGGGQKSALLKKLVIDTIIWKFDTKTSLSYMKLIGGIDCSESYYFKIKRRVLSDEEINYWLNEHMKVGFARAHKMEIEELERIKAPMLEVYYQETSKSYMMDSGKKTEEGKPIMINNPAYNIEKVMKLAVSIDSLNKSLDDLNTANPLVQAIKQKIEKAKQEQHEEPKHNESVTPTN